MKMTNWAGLDEAGNWIGVKEESSDELLEDVAANLNQYGTRMAVSVGVLAVTSTAIPPTVGTPVHDHPCMKLIMPDTIRHHLDLAPRVPVAVVERAVGTPPLITSADASHDDLRDADFGQNEWPIGEGRRNNRCDKCNGLGHYPVECTWGEILDGPKPEGPQWCALRDR